jgi:hypothetical protein
VTLPHGVQVATDALRTEAGVWDQQSAAMGRLATTMDGMRMNRLEAGVFQLIIGPYSTLVDQVNHRCQEGSGRMTEIADTLRQVARTYDQEELNDAHRLRNLR